MGPGPLIAIGVILLYTIIGPLVLFAIYVLFDSLDRLARPSKKQQQETVENKDPALWTSEDVEASDVYGPNLDGAGRDRHVERI